MKPESVLAEQNQTAASAGEMQTRMQAFLPRAEAAAREARTAFRSLRQSPGRQRDAALYALANLLDQPERRREILAENARDIEAGRANGLRGNLIDRLELNESRLDSMARALREIAAMPDPVGEVIRGHRLQNGVAMIQKRVPLGVVFTIYESRPNVTVDVGALCIKSGNAAVLRGGKEALHSNQILYRLFREALEQVELPASAVQLVEEVDRAYMLALLQQDALIDLVVPRGGEQLIRFIVQNSRIPVVKHDKGVCNLFIDASADPEQALAIAINAKLQRTSVCNAIENLLVHKDYPRAAELLQGLAAAGADLLGCSETRRIFPEARPIAPEDEDAEYGQEYLDERLAVKVVPDLAAAADFIYRYGSGHSEAIVSRDQHNVRAFETAVDAAAVFVNCSTRFHDGGQLGMGAEVGISTGRLHVRGPMGVRDLTTTTYVLEGAGQIRQ